MPEALPELVLLIAFLTSSKVVVMRGKGGERGGRTFGWRSEVKIVSDGGLWVNRRRSR